MALAVFGGANPIGFERALRRAPVAVLGVAVVALFVVGLDFPIPAEVDDLALVITAVVFLGGIRWGVALFAIFEVDPVESSVAAVMRVLAVRGAGAKTVVGVEKPVVALFAVVGFADAVSAAHGRAQDARFGATKSRFDRRAIGGAPVAIVGVAVVTGFVSGDDPVAASRALFADATELWASPSRFDRRAVGGAPVAVLGVAVVADFGGFHGAVAAFRDVIGFDLDAGIFVALIPRFHRTIGGTPVAVLRVAVVTGFRVVENVIATNGLVDGGVRLWGVFATARQGDQRGHRDPEMSFHRLYSTIGLSMSWCARGDAQRSDHLP